ncbi:MAG: hypothetical protein K1X54_07920 [Flavobacteriales bacterium]|nr:hypothetical protein [Flavobacteriales bacterium]
MERSLLKYRLLFLSFFMVISVCVYAQPANDDCLNAEPIACGTSVNGTTVTATNETVPAGCYLNNTSPSVWYTLIGDGSNITVSICGTTWDSQIAVYSGTCAALTCIGYNDDGCGTSSTYTFPSVIGVTYYVRVFGYGAASGTFTLTTTCVPSTVPNDACVNAIALACDASVTGTTIGATADPIAAGCYVYNTSPGVWYTFTGTGGMITASLCGSSFDTQLSVMTGSCGAFTCQTYNDDGCGTQSVVTVSTTPGTIYYVYVQGYFTSSGPFTLSLTCVDPPPPANCGDIEANGCPDIDLGADISLPNCPSPCTPLTLNAQYFETGNTTSYSVCQIPYTPYPYNTGTGFSIGVDDVWTPVINLPFNFCFYGVNYSQCIVGSNGLISFNIGDAGLYCPWSFTAPCPSPALPRNAIFGVYHDIDPAVLCSGVPCGDARFATFGTAPCRVFVVSFDNVPHFSGACNALRTSCEIVLYETTNVIEVYVENKPVCSTWNSGNALIGVQNVSATSGFTPPGRNTGPWAAVTEGWRFIPSGGSNVTINWYDQVGLIGTGSSISVCPDQVSETFVATATYTQCNGSTIVVSDDVIVQCASLQLPVEWLSFEVKPLDDGRENLCEWITATEENNDYFSVQRSNDNEHWEDIGIVDGSGNSLSLKRYVFYDRHPLWGLSYYRIAQTDFNGEIQYSEVRSINRESSTDMSIYPNPAHAKAVIQPWTEGSIIVLLDQHGRKIPCNWNHQGELDLTGISPGSYIIELHIPLTSDVKRCRLVVAK